MKKPNSDDILPQSPGCPGAIKVPTDREVKALAALKKIKEQTRQLKDQLGDLKVGAPEREILEKRLSRLREDWNSWEKEREAAAHERMAILGHE